MANQKQPKTTERNRRPHAARAGRISGGNFIGTLPFFNRFMPWWWLTLFEGLPRRGSGRHQSAQKGTEIENCALGIAIAVGATGYSAQMVGARSWMTDARGCRPGTPGQVAGFRQDTSCFARFRQDSPFFFRKTVDWFFMPVTVAVVWEEWPARQKRTAPCCAELRIAACSCKFSEKILLTDCARADFSTAF